MNTIETLLTEKEVAQRLNVSVATIRRRRLFRQPPEWIKIGASVRYRSEAIDRLIESNTCSLAEQRVSGKPQRRDHSGEPRNGR
jgi:predicted DNA-binding transcriptional regulator AlpA